MNRIKKTFHLFKKEMSWPSLEKCQILYRSSSSQTDIFQRSLVGTSTNILEFIQTINERGITRFATNGKSIYLRYDFNPTHNPRNTINKKTKECIVNSGDVASLDAASLAAFIRILAKYTRYYDSDPMYPSFMSIMDFERMLRDETTLWHWSDVYEHLFKLGYFDNGLEDMFKLSEMIFSNKYIHSKFLRNLIDRHFIMNKVLGNTPVVNFHPNSNERVLQIIHERGIVIKSHLFPKFVGDTFSDDVQLEDGDRRTKGILIADNKLRQNFENLIKEAKRRAGTHFEGVRIYMYTSENKEKGNVVFELIGEQAQAHAREMWNEERRKRLKTYWNDAIRFTLVYTSSTCYSYFKTLTPQHVQTALQSISPTNLFEYLGKLLFRYESEDDYLQKTLPEIFNLNFISQFRSQTMNANTWYCYRDIYLSLQYQKVYEIDDIESFRTEKLQTYWLLVNLKLAEKTGQVELTKVLLSMFQNPTITPEFIVLNPMPNIATSTMVDSKVLMLIQNIQYIVNDANHKLIMQQQMMQSSSMAGPSSMPSSSMHDAMAAQHAVARTPSPYVSNQEYVIDFTHYLTELPMVANVDRIAFSVFTNSDRHMSIGKQLFHELLQLYGIPGMDQYLDIVYENFGLCLRVYKFMTRTFHRTNCTKFFSYIFTTDGYNSFLQNIPSDSIFSV